MSGRNYFWGRSPGKWFCFAVIPRSGENSRTEIFAFLHGDRQHLRNFSRWLNKISRVGSADRYRCSSFFTKKEAKRNPHRGIYHPGLKRCPVSIHVTNQAESDAGLACWEPSSPAPEVRVLGKIFCVWISALQAEFAAGHTCRNAFVLLVFSTVL